MPAVLPQYPFRLHVAPFEAEGLVVAEFDGREAMSRPYAVDLLALTPGPLALEDLPPVGAPCSLVMQGNQYEESPPRRIHGLLSRVSLDGVAHEHGGTWLRLRLVPRLWKLRRRRTRRIFQDRTVLQIIDAIFGAHNVAWRYAIDTALPPMAYCVQYDETDYEFVKRLLARFGLFYYFEQSEAEPGSAEAVETIVVCDSARHYGMIAWAGSREPRVLKLVDRAGTFRPDEAVLRFAFDRRADPTAARLRDWDFRAPAGHGEFAQNNTSDPSLGANELLIDEFENRAGNDAIRTSRRDARTAIEQHRASGTRGRGASDCQAFAPGLRFILNNHDVAHLNVDWVLTEVIHEGRVPEIARVRTEGPGSPLPDPVYQNRFVCAPAAVPVRLPRPPRVLRQVTETAAVVGPAGEEIYTDEYGRVRLQFHWDRDGGFNELSSCWARVSQAWAGAGWGFQFIPRIGMEVLVTFVGGDTDHPVVTGCLYNAARPPSHPLPVSKTRSGIRTQTTPGGDPSRSNEIAFEDSAGEELFYLHAQKDLREVVLNDHSEWIGANESTQVGANRTDAVTNDERRAVGRDRTQEVTRNSAERVGGDREVRVDGQSRHWVGKEAEVNVADSLEVNVGGKEQRSVREQFDWLFHSDRVERVRGSHTLLVGRHDAKQSCVLHTEGNTTMGATEGTEIWSDKEVVLRCGRSSIRLAPDRIEISSPTIVAVGQGGRVKLGDDEVRVRAEKRAFVFSEKILLVSEGANVALSKEAKIDGDKILLNSPERAEDPVQDEAPQPTKISLVGKNGEPMPFQRYRITTADGQEHTGLLDKNGRAEVDVAVSGELTFPDLAEWEPGG